MKIKKISLTIIIVLCLMAGIIYPTYGALLLLVSFMIMLLGEILPVSLGALTVLCLIPLMGITTNLPLVFKGFSEPVIFFMMASFGIAYAFAKVPLTKRILKKILEHSGSSIESIIFALMLCTVLVSSVMSNVPSCLIFMAVGRELLNLYPEEADRKQTGRPVMLGITFASMIGGILTPVGSSINILILNLMANYTDKTITFWQWMCVSIPVTLLILPVCWWLLIKIFCPAHIPMDMKKQFIAKLNVPEKIDMPERKVIAIMGGMILLWILSSWITEINVILVAIMGCVLLQFPGIKVMDHHEFIKSISWDAIFLVATVLSLGNLIVGSIDLEAVASVLPTTSSDILAIMLTAGIVFVGLVFIPVAPSLVTVLIPILALMSQTSNISLTALAMTCAICAGNCYLFPLDTVCMMTYGEGYYSMTDMPKVSILIQIWIVVVVSILVPVLGKLVGLF